MLGKGVILLCVVAIIQAQKYGKHIVKPVPVFQKEIVPIVQKELVPVVQHKIVPIIKPVHVPVPHQVPVYVDKQVPVYVDRLVPVPVQGGKGGIVGGSVAAAGAIVGGLGGIGDDNGFNNNRFNN